MPTPVTCPSCHTAYTLADDLLGKKVRCKKCGGTIVVGSSSSGITRSRNEDEPEPPAPRRRRRAEMDVRQVGRKSHGLLIGLIVGGAGLLLLSGGIIVAGVYFLAGKVGGRRPTRMP